MPTHLIAPPISAAWEIFKAAQTPLKQNAELHEGGETERLHRHRENTRRHQI